MTLIDSIIPPRRCTKCSEEYPATAEYFSKKKGGKYGLRSICKSCQQADLNRWRADNPESQQAYRAAHAAQIAQTKRRWEQNHPEKVLAHRRRTKRLHREQGYLAQKRYQATERGKLTHRLVMHRRRARKLSSGSYTHADVELLLKSSLGKCWWCGKGVGNDWHLDHRIPLAKGGSNNPDNLCISCPGCNHSKGAKLPHEWSDRLL